MNPIDYKLSCMDVLYSIVSFYLLNLKLKTEMQVQYWQWFEYLKKLFKKKLQKNIFFVFLNRPTKPQHR